MLAVVAAFPRFIGHNITWEQDYLARCGDFAPLFHLPSVSNPISQLDRSAALRGRPQESQFIARKPKEKTSATHLRPDFTGIVSALANVEHWRSTMPTNGDQPFASSFMVSTLRSMVSGGIHQKPVTPGFHWFPPEYSPYFYDRAVHIGTTSNRAVLQMGTGHMICPVAFYTSYFSYVQFTA
ncbi:hypothetical protein C8R45DRAFT_922669 [Mycena sanguinolenta]|nr:hypothetical protein C8R45DRAFT_922669 [Mycena sanguinolenta]